MSAKLQKSKRISIPLDDYETLQRIALREATSVSGLLLQAAAPMITAERANKAKMLSIIDLGDGTDDEGSVNHNEAYAKARSAFGTFRDNASDVSGHHDRYLGDNLLK